MTGDDLGLVGKSEQAGVDGVDDLVVVAAGQVGTADASGKKGIASEDHFERSEMETDGALGVARSVDDLGGIVFEPNAPAFRESLVGRGGCGSFDTEPGRLGGHHLEEGQVAFVEIDGRSGQRFQLKCAPDVVDVSVGDKDLFQGESVFCEAAMNASYFVARVDHDGFVGLLVTEDGAVAFKRTDRKGLEDHGYIVETGSRE